MITAEQLQIIATFAEKHGVEIMLTKDGIEFASLGESCAEYTVTWVVLGSARFPGDVMRAAVLRVCEANS